MVQINLTKKQYQNALKGKCIQIPHHQLMSNHGDFAVDLDFDKKTMNTMRRNVSNGKGFRIPKGLMNTGATLAKQGAKLAGNYAANEGAKQLNKAINNSTYIPDSMKGTLSGLSNQAVGAVKTAGLSQINNRIDGLQQGQGFFQDVGRALKPVGKILKPVAKAVLPTVATMAGNYIGGPMAGKIAGDLTTQGVKGMGLRKFKKGSAEAKAHMANIRAMRGKGMFSNMAKAAVKAAAPTIIKAGSKMATDALINHVSGQGGAVYRHIGIGPPPKNASKSSLVKINGQGVYKPNLRRRNVMGAVGSKMPRGRPVNPRVLPDGRIITKGIDQVHSNVNPVTGGSFASWGYA